MAGSEPAQKVRPKEFDGTQERRLIEAAQSDPVHFGALYEHSFEMVYAYTARRVRDRHETEDLTAEVFRKALANLPRFKWTGAPFGAWLLRIASNLIADRSKRAAREDKVVDPSLPVEPGPRAQANSAQAQHQDLEDAERQAELFILVNQLADDQRKVILMRFAQEKPISEIANELQRSEGAVKQLQFRALENLRKAISPPSDPEEELK
jgi:RNA polymerase sigma-70 factor, ECF subfamily